ncbi:lysine-rich arabinogalactan protein 19-like [Acanthopagrus latus]|uniref:lysine-rich arabinogalactan protein 19-like n=1 Tax=Acanthopagrus latus TaxID=8177 RepID=UPI00187C576A|nr:lysine-rich arabinogalactan protein 19-like [Acanthopagrus latus]
MSGVPSHLHDHIYWSREPGRSRDRPQASRVFMRCLDHDRSFGRSCVWFHLGRCFARSAHLLGAGRDRGRAAPEALRNLLREDCVRELLSCLTRAPALNPPPLTLSPPPLSLSPPPLSLSPPPLSLSPPPLPLSSPPLPFSSPPLQAILILILLILILPFSSPPLQSVLILILLILILPFSSPSLQAILILSLPLSPPPLSLSPPPLPLSSPSLPLSPPSLIDCTCTCSVFSTASPGAMQLISHPLFSCQLQ